MQLGCKIFDLCNLNKMILKNPYLVHVTFHMTVTCSSLEYNHTVKSVRITLNIIISFDQSEAASRLLSPARFHQVYANECSVACVCLCSSGSDHAVCGRDERGHRSHRDHPVALPAHRLKGDTQFDQCV